MLNPSARQKKLIRTRVPYWKRGAGRAHRESHKKYKTEPSQLLEKLDVHPRLYGQPTSTKKKTTPRTAVRVRI